MDLAHELGLSQSEVSEGLERCRRAGLVDPSKKLLFKDAFLEFLLHGIRYVFPIEPGAVCRGLPTAHSAPPLAKKIIYQDSDRLVWPDDKGTVRGQSIQPLYPSVPAAARKDPALYEFLALIDALRIGRAREQKMATLEISKRIKANAKL